MCFATLSMIELSSAHVKEPVWGEKPSSACTGPLFECARWLIDTWPIFYLANHRLTSLRAGLKSYWVAAGCDQYESGLPFPEHLIPPYDPTHRCVHGNPFEEADPVDSAWTANNLQGFHFHHCTSDPHMDSVLASRNMMGKTTCCST